jgi:hypothetical protein
MASAVPPHPIDKITPTNPRPPSVVSEKYLSRSFQADLFVGKQNSITFPRSCGGIHFVRFEKLVGM